MQRCLYTANLTFGSMGLLASQPFSPVIKELLREALGVHTCDRRSSKSTISKKWPTFQFEAGFEEQDQLWDADLRESRSHHVHRMLTLLDDIFRSDDSHFVSCTSHSGTISVMLEAVGHREFPLQTGGIIPVFVKASRVNGPRPVGKIEPPHREPVC